VIRLAAGAGVEGHDGEAVRELAEGAFRLGVAGQARRAVVADEQPVAVALHVHEQVHAVDPDLLLHGSSLPRPSWAGPCACAQWAGDDLLWVVARRRAGAYLSSQTLLKVVTR